MESVRCWRRSLFFYEVQNCRKWRLLCFKKSLNMPGPHKRGIYAATVVILASVTMGVLPFVLAYQVITPLVMGAEIDTSFVISRVALVLACLVLQAVLYGWGLSISHRAAYNTLLRLRVSLQKRFENLPLATFRPRAPAQQKNYLWTMWTAWNCLWLTLCQRVLGI